MIGPGECHVWWARADAATQAHRGWLTAQERARASRWATAADRRRFVTGRVVLRSVVGACLDRPPSRVPLDAACGRCGGPHGRPRLAGCPVPLELSLAHAGDRVVVAVSRGATVGVDVEPLPTRALDPAVAAAALAPCERLALASLPPPDRPAAFTRYWTRKEAVLKAHGHGVAAGPVSVVVSPPWQSPRLLAAALDPPLLGPVRLDDLHPEGEGRYVASIALVGATGAVTQHWWPPGPLARGAVAPAAATPSR